MPLPEWNPEFSVGSKMLDDQHKVILQLCASIHNLTRSDPEYLDKLHIALNDMSAYAEKHFAEEERILAEIHYPDIKSHRSEHMNYHESLTQLLFDAMQGNVEVSKLSEFLETWWIDHILNSDMKYKPYLTSPQSA